MLWFNGNVLIRLGDLCHAVFKQSNESSSLFQNRVLPGECLQTRPNLTSIFDIYCERRFSMIANPDKRVPRLKVGKVGESCARAWQEMSEPCHSLANRGPEVSLGLECSSDS